ncbi:hypothetical protein ACFQX8_12270 [Klenkia terrae]|uniref:hypothetical protein n=1 Tax=Klenkia terrae TaxID=1052259 RepID=UPI00360FCAB9
MAAYFAGGAGDSEGAGEESAEAGTGLTAHIAAALGVVDTGRAHLGRRNALSRDVVRLAAHSPGNIAWRALGRVLAEADVSPQGRWHAAVHLAAGLRSLFNRLEGTLVIGEDDAAYWRSVLDYCAAGNLQAVLDEYVHHLRSSFSDGPLDDDGLLDLAGRIVSAITLRVVNYAPISRCRTTVHACEADLRCVTARRAEPRATAPRLRKSGSRTCGPPSTARSGPSC